MKKTTVFICAVFVLMFNLLSSCNKADEIEIKYMAVQLVDSKMWSIIDVETGELLYRDEFKHEPSLVVNGVFYVQNDEGTYDYYNVLDVKKPINKEHFKAVTSFNAHGIALAVKKGGTIHIINEKCESVKDLGKEVASCELFDNGTAVFTNYQGQKGIMAEDGSVIVKPEYDYATNFSEGIAIVGIEEKNEMKKYSVINKKNEVLYTFSSKEYETFTSYHEGMLPVSTPDNDKSIYFLDKEGKKVAKFGNNKDGYPIYSYALVDGITVFNEGESWGIKNAMGEVLIRAKYDNLYIMKDGTMVARKDDKYGIINRNDETVFPFEHEQLYVVREGRYLCGNKKYTSLVDAEGKDIGTNNYADFSLNARTAIESNYFDAPSAVRKVMELFDDASCNGIKAGETLRDFKHLLTYSEYYYKDKYSLDERDYSKGVSYVYGFDSAISKEKYDYLYGYRFYDGVAFNYSAKCICVCIIGLSVEDYDIDAEEKFVEEFERQLRNNGYIQSDKPHYYQNKNGVNIGVDYREGNIGVWYFFPGSNLIDIQRTPRERVGDDGNLATSDMDVIADTVAVDTIAE